jgi:hypothetical protein
MKGSSLALLLAVLVAGASGLAAGWFLRGGAPAPVQPLQVHAADGVTREELEAAKREILAQLGLLGRTRAAGAPTAAAPANDVVIELGRRIDDLDARIALSDKEAPRAKGTPLWTPPRGPGSGSIDAMIQRIQDWYHPSHTDRSGDDIEEQLRREHDLWTFEDVVRAYGEPRRWERCDGGWDLYFGSFVVEGWDDKHSIEFCLREGYLQNVEIAETQP